MSDDLVEQAIKELQELVMAIADYKLCDVCQGKAFYDLNISDPNYTSTWDEDEDWDGVELAVLCSRCKKTHKITISAKGQDDE